LGYGQLKQPGAHLLGCERHAVLGLAHDIVVLGAEPLWPAHEVGVTPNAMQMSRVVEAPWIEN
jgi:hypothetical protein